MTVENLQLVVAAERKKYGTPMTAPERGALLNAVAWAHRLTGWGLLAKPSGSNVPQPVTGTLVAGDILFHQPSTTHFDVLQDGEGAGVPCWQDKGPMDLLRWVPPVESGTPPPPPPVGDLEKRVGALEAWLIVDDEKIKDLVERVGEFTYADLDARITALEHAQPPVVPELTYTADCGRTWGHAHPVTVTAKKK